MKKVLVLHGPNINLTGIREPGTYGKQTLEQINKSIGQLAQQLGVACDIFQSNHEGELIDLLHRYFGDSIEIEVGYVSKEQPRFEFFK